MQAGSAQSLWAATASAAPALTSLAGALRADVAVVGAGFTGLSAALHLGIAGRAVAIIEAAGLGERASGLNGGQVIPGVKADPDSLEETFGPRRGARLVAAVASGPDLVYELIARHAIACDAVRSGWIQAATSERTLGQLDTRVAQWRQRGAAIELLSAAAVAQLTGTASYCGGLLDRRGGTVQPLSYVRGLAAAVLRGGGRIFAHSPALQLRRAAREWRIETPHGSLSAPSVIVATNAYSGALIGALRRSIVTVPSFQVATAPLPAALLATILPGGQATSDTRQLLRYFRLDAGGRFVLGARGVFGAQPGPNSSRHHYRAVRELFPQLAGLSFEYHWGGLVAMTADHLPHLHELAPGLLAGLGYNGRGVAMATLMGRLLAQRTLGMSDEELAFPVTPVRPIRLHGAASLAARTAIQYLRALELVTRTRDRLRGRSSWT
ncbi:MAG TPA: FAD-binding oxidoreductase [Steroidobacteraceae bacterium]|jgi:glycine/D-amino acid oxidase-like deaminating enzyme|nr:FAD-binding oxidoreductase [Steroidobacteraceae bacterium]